MRLDTWLTQLGHFQSRQKAQIAIKAGLVLVDGEVVTKPSFVISSSHKVELTGKGLKYVSRGGLKLEKAIKHFGLNFSNKRVLDAGASAGGFTDCALQHGAHKVYAVDIGSDQLDNSLRNNPKVICYENTDIRQLTLTTLDNQQVDIVVADLSFISLTHILPHLHPLMHPNGFLIALIKPQFELEQRKKLKRGIVTDQNQREGAINRVVESASKYSFFLKGLVNTDVEDERKKNLEYMAMFTVKH